MNKKLYLLPLLLAMVCVCIIVACDNPKKTISYNELPSPSKSFIESYFNPQSLQRIVHDVKDNEYKVYTTDGNEIIFDKFGSWKDIETQPGSFPGEILKLLPAPLTQYLSETYPNHQIVELSKESYGYKVDLASTPTTEIKFKADGSFISAK